jgi:hypothetical protein
VLSFARFAFGADFIHPDFDKRRYARCRKQDVAGGVSDPIKDPPVPTIADGSSPRAGSETTQVDVGLCHPGGPARPRPRRIEAVEEQ